MYIVTRTFGMSLSVSIFLLVLFLNIAHVSAYSSSTPAVALPDVQTVESFPTTTSIGEASSQTITVCKSGCQYSTIQSAVNNANSDDTINVKSGIYNEVVNVNKPLKLVGQSAVIRPNASTSLLVGGSTLRAAILVNSDDVTIEGFEIDGTKTSVHYGIYVYNSDNSIVKNNVIHDLANSINSPANDSAGIGILFFGWLQSVNNNVIEQNKVYNCARMCVFVGGQRDSSMWILSSNNVIRDNEIYNGWTGPTSQTGQGSVTLVGILDDTIEGNSIHDNTHRIASGEIVGYGIYIAGSASPASTILNNVLYNNVQGLTIITKDKSVDFNSIAAATPLVHYNKIYDNVLYGMRGDVNNKNFVINASLNWWGSSTGPYNASTNPGGTGNGVWGNLIFKPYYIDSAMTVLSSNGGSTGQSNLVVKTRTSAGPLPSYYTVLYQNNNVVATGFSPATFQLNNGQQYAVEPQDYGEYIFDHWDDTGSTNRRRIISISSNTEITAVYSKKTQSSGSIISVSSVDSSNNALSGYYTTLWQNGQQLQSGFTLVSFNVNENQKYQIAVADYGSYVFDHWSDGVTNRFHDVTATSGTINLKAIYKKI